MSSPRAAFVYSDAYVEYHLGDSHPLQQKRLRMNHRLLQAYGAFRRPGSDWIVPTPATAQDLGRIHTPEYLDALRTLSAGGHLPDKRRFGFGTLDNPPFAGMWEATLLYAGGSLECARLIWEDGYDAAFNNSGGLHHARPDRAAGFCTVADIALVACYFLDRGVSRIAYVDLDAHHGDGVQEIFYDDPRVLTLSIHETPESLYPRKTGFVTEIGTDAGRGYNANLPMARGSGDAVYAEAFDAAFVPLLGAFDPEVVLLQVGADSLAGDRLAHLRLTTHGWLALAERVLSLGRPVIALGGGGYSLPAVARLWTLLYGRLSGQTFPDTVPEPYATDWGIPHLHDRAELLTAPEEEAATREYALRSIAFLQQHVFPRHGL